MSGTIIDAKSRFYGDRPNADATGERAEQRRQSRMADLARLRTTLRDPKRIEFSDRRIIVRKFGRLIERRYPEEKKAWASRLISAAFGDQAESILKKRARYIRFEGEDISDGDQLFATRRDVLRLSDAWAGLSHDNNPTEEQKAQVLASVCEGTSFFEPARPRLSRGKDSLEEFRLRMEEMIDRVARETDITSYLDQIRHYDIETLPRSKSDISEEEIFALNEQCFPLSSFKHGEGEIRAYKDYSRLRLSGYNFRAEEPPALLPRVRLARVYWPRTVLCLDAGAPAVDVRMAYRSAELDGEERRLREKALRDGGHNSMDVAWDDFIDPLSGEALPGASWRVFWQARSIDLHLTAHSEPEALALGISALEPHWPCAPKDLLEPQDDTVKGAEIDNCVISDEEGDLFAWFPDGDKMLVCRGFSEEQLVPGTEEDPLGPTYETIRYEPAECEIYEGLVDLHFGPLSAGPAWELMTLPMQDWQSVFMANRSWRIPPEVQPALRPLFTAPAGWTPAPDDTLASAILRSLAYGEGSERLDAKLMAAVNHRVACLDEMRMRSELAFEDGLTRSGYGRSGEAP